jgi:hypothetical protein
LKSESDLDYEIDFPKFFLKDRKKVKRASAQQLEIVPLCIEPARVIQGDKKAKMVIVLPKFTISKDQRCCAAVVPAVKEAEGYAADALKNALAIK